MLATRRLPLDGRRADALQGRETWLVPVAFEDGWPVFAPGTGRLADEVDVPWAEAQAIGARTLVDDFDGPALHPELLFVRSAASARRARLGERPGHLRLHAVSGSLHERVPHAFAGFRLEQPAATLSTVVEAPDAPSPGLLAGLALRLSERRHVTLGVRAGTAGRLVELALHVDGEDRVLGVADVPAGRLGLALEIDGFEAVARVEYGERRRSSARPTSRRSARVRAAGSWGSSAGCSSWARRIVTDADAAPAAWADFDLLSLVHPPAH